MCNSKYCSHEYSKQKHQNTQDFKGGFRSFARQEKGSTEPLGNIGYFPDFSKWRNKPKATDDNTQAMYDYLNFYSKEKEERKKSGRVPKITSNELNVLRYMQDKLPETNALFAQSAITKCLTGIYSNVKYGELVESIDGKSDYKFTCTCGCNGCPYCSNQKEYKFAFELEKLVSAHLTDYQNSSVICSVLTFPHDLYADPYDLMRKFRWSLEQTLKHSKEWLRKIGFEQQYYAYSIEITGSIANGWHQHVNLVFLGTEDHEIKQYEARNLIQAEWNKWLERLYLKQSSKAHGVKVNIIRDQDDAEKLTKYLNKNSFKSILNLALEIGSSRNKTGAIKQGVRRWQPFELLIDSYVHRKSDKARSDCHFELFVEYLQLTEGMHLRRFSKSARAKIREIEKSEQQQLESEKKGEEQEERTIAFIGREEFQSIRDNDLLYSVLTLPRTDLNGQQCNDVLSNILRIDKYMDIASTLKSPVKVISPSHYLSLVLAKEQNDNLEDYLKRYAENLNVDDFMVLAERVDFEDTLARIDEINEEYRKEQKLQREKKQQAKKAKLEQELKENEFVFYEFKRQKKRSLRKRFLTKSEIKRFSRDLYRAGETKFFIKLLDYGISPTKFMKYIPRARSRGVNWRKFYERAKARLGFDFGDYKQVEKILNHWANQPEIIIDNVYFKWEKAYRSSFNDF